MFGRRLDSALLSFCALSMCGACSSSKNSRGPGPHANGAVSVAPVGTGASSADSTTPPFASVRASKVPRTADGIPILTARPKEAGKDGGVSWIRAAFKATDSLPRHEATDGESLYLVVDGDASMLLRDGVVHENVMKRYGIARGGCGAARNGTLLLSGTAPTGGVRKTVTVHGGSSTPVTTHEPMQGQIVILIDDKGEEQRISVPSRLGHEEDCRAWLADDGRFSVALFDIATYDGQRFGERPNGLGWYAGRTVLGKVGGPRFCFSSCNRTEAQETHPATSALKQALDFQSGPSPEWVAFEDWVAGASTTRAVRTTITSGKSPKIEVVEGLPASKMLNGSVDLAFTREGHLVIGLDYRFRRYVVWPAGTSRLSPMRTLADGEVMSKSHPTAIVRGLTTAMPESNTFAVVLGKHIGVGTGGSTYDQPDLRRSPLAHDKRFARAKKVLGAGQFVVAHEAVIDTKCGAYVRSPVGWEGMHIHDWTPPTLPPLSPRAVSRGKPCVPLSNVSALPSDPDLLLGLSGGKLHAAWLPPPLPLPPGKSHFHPQPPKPLPRVTPRPGTGWTMIGDASQIRGIDALPAPGRDTQVVPHTWISGGGAVITTGNATVLLTKMGAVTLPKGTKPMAVGQHGSMHVFGALGSLLVVCKKACRVLDPGPQKDIVAVVPRTKTTVVIGYADGTMGSYTPKETGGRKIAQHAIATALEAVLAQKPKP